MPLTTKYPPASWIRISPNQHKYILDTPQLLHDASQAHLAPNVANDTCCSKIQNTLKTLKCASQYNVQYLYRYIFMHVCILLMQYIDAYI